MRAYNLLDVADCMINPSRTGDYNDAWLGANKVFKNFVKTYSDEKHIEVPVIMDWQLKSSVKNFSFDNTYVYPITSNEDYSEHVGSIATALKHMVNNWGNNLYSVECKGERYMGGSGIIMDSNYKVLLLASTIYKTTIGDNRSALNALTLERGMKIYLHPSLFLDDSKELNRNICRKFIPQFLRSHVKPEVIIKCPNHLLYSTKGPLLMDPKKEADAENEILYQNLDEILLSARDNYYHANRR